MLQLLRGTTQPIVGDHVFFEWLFPKVEAVFDHFTLPLVQSKKKFYKFSRLLPWILFNLYELL